MKSQHIGRLRQWIQTPPNSQSLVELRNILGEIMVSVNAASHIFGWAPEITPDPAQVQEVLADIVNYDQFQMMVPEVDRKIEQVGGVQKPLLRNILHTLEQSKFAPHQIKMLEQMANPQLQKKGPRYAKRMDVGAAQKFVQNAVYNLPGASAKTLKVIREILQNAVDATDPKQHPELLNRPDFKPEVHLDYYMHEKYLDLIAYDKGIGMNWNIMREKFFTTFESGKSSTPGAAGGFGIAKALIQDTPEHGWSIDTNGIHSSRFHKDIYMGVDQDDPEHPPITPTSKIQRNPQGGTILSLYALPKVYSGDIESLCEVYGTNGTVAIFLNGKQVKPRFTLDSSEITGNINDLPNLMSDNELERKTASEVFSKDKKALGIASEKVYDGGATKAKFFFRKNTGSGSLYVMINGQYQFDEMKYINKLDIICSIETTARPNTPLYPIDPGREKIRKDISSDIEAVVKTVQSFTEKSANDDLLKQGIEAIMVNPNAEPMSTTPTEKQIRQRESLTDVLYADLDNAMERTPEQMLDKILQSYSDVITSGGSGGGGGGSVDINLGGGSGNGGNKPSGDFGFGDDEFGNTGGGSGGVPGQQDDYWNKPEFGGPGVPSGGVPSHDVPPVRNDVTPIQKAVVEALLEQMPNFNDRVEQREKIEEIIDGLTTPANIMIQKNFVGREEMDKRMDLIAEMTILWQRTLKLIIARLSVALPHIRDEKFIPGLIFSDEAHGLYMPPSDEPFGQPKKRPYSSVSVNPITLAAAVEPKLFREKLSGNRDEYRGKPDAFDAIPDQEQIDKKDDTPTERVAKFLFHIGIHELCHLIYPDSKYSGSENFHNHITYMEILCHVVYDNIYQETKKYMTKLRSKSKMLITLIAKHKKKSVKESVMWREFSHEESPSVVLVATYAIIMESLKRR